MSDVTDEMVRAAWRERVVPMGGYEDWRVVIGAALSAAPTVEDFWTKDCDNSFPVPDGHGHTHDAKVWLCRDVLSVMFVKECADSDCLGPHHTLLRGPEVTP
jgi:hypothetical protein